MNGTVGCGRSNSVDNLRSYIQEPKTFLYSPDPEGSLYGIAISRKSLDETTAIVDLIIYQRALIHGSTPFSIAS